jgi:hypothetical protein
MVSGHAGWIFIGDETAGGTARCGGSRESRQTTSRPVLTLEVVPAGGRTSRGARKDAAAGHRQIHGGQRPGGREVYGATATSSVIMPSAAWKKMWQCIAQRPTAPPVGVAKSNGRSSSRTLYTSLEWGGMFATSTNSL